MPSPFRLHIAKETSSYNFGKCQKEKKKDDNGHFYYKEIENTKTFQLLKKN